MPKKKINEEGEITHGKHPLWSGSLSFGLINIPVYLYSGSKDRALKFHLLHKDDYSTVGYKKICHATGEELAESDIVKGYEIEKNQYVILNKSDFEKADARKISTIEISNFIDEKEIDPIYYDKPYFIEADKKAEKAYTLLREALKKSHKAGVATFVMREREELGVIRASGNALILNQLRYQDEVRSSAGLNLPEAKSTAPEEMEIAMLLIEKLSKPFDISKYKDTYSDALLRVIKERAKGNVPKMHGEPAKETPTKDLMSMLKKSLSKHGA